MKVGPFSRANERGPVYTTSIMLSSRPVTLAMDSHVYPSKTPGRMKAKVENAVPMMVHAKGKKVVMQTPFNGGKQGISSHGFYFFCILIVI